MTKLSFTEKDKDMLIDFLNYIAKKATFNQNVEESIKFVKLLSHMQQVILPKIEDNILEIRKIHEAPKENGNE